MSLAALVETVGKMNQYWQRHARTWSDVEWLERRKKLKKLLEEMETGLVAQGKNIADFGWTLTPDAQWKRLGEPDPPSRLTEEDRQQFSSFDRAEKREAREAAQPELAGVAGDQPGTCPFS